MIKKQTVYIFCDTAKAAEVGILKSGRRESLDGSMVILHEDDFALYFPVINEKSGEIALTLEAKAKMVNGRILTMEQAQREIQGNKWNNNIGKDE